ncbi:class I SAM-dependent methyltransferase [Kordiimonas aestuarii]|uniref:class I SAM-dependent methyltransferase n=1 Tax=Kordiimonas aestuarii TaxID=1005925 RepID=UPI0021D1EBC4|nr:class I SAM-dependent methyltransferase [Kordiimonas aestuarii]
MREDVLEFLQCPNTGAPLEILSVEERNGSEIIEAILTTTGTENSQKYSVSYGVPNFIAALADHDQRQSISTFGAEWQKYNYWGWLDDVPEGDEPLQYIGGLLSFSRMFFKLKTQFDHIDLPDNPLVLDTGCGNGRHSFQAREAGIRNIISMDASEAVYVARKNFLDRGIDGVTFVRGNVLNMPLRSDALDYAFTIGVMQHTGGPQQLLHEMARVTKPDGAVSVNCYGTGTVIYETLDLMLRAVTTRLPRTQQQTLAAAFSRFGRWIWPGRETGFRKFIFQNMNIMPTDHHMFDWYGPRIADHYSPQQLLRFFERAGLVPQAGNFEIWKDGYDDTFRRTNHQAFAIYLKNNKAAAGSTPTEGV